MMLLQHLLERRLRFRRINAELSIGPRLDAVVLRLGERSPAPGQGWPLPILSRSSSAKIAPAFKD
jgi:hypothetical protein